MAKNNGELLVRIDERVRTIFNEISEIKKMQEESDKRHYHCQIEVLPKMMSEIKLLKERPLGITAFLAVLFKKLM